MTSEEFVSRIRVAVYESTIRGSLSQLEKPAGRRPSPALTEISQWFNRLSPAEKEHLRAVIQFAVGNAVFGMLTVLDGVTAIRQAGEERGILELRYHTQGQSVLLNDPEGEPLHDIFGALVPPV